MRNIFCHSWSGLVLNPYRPLNLSILGSKLTLESTEPWIYQPSDPSNLGTIEPWIYRHGPIRAYGVVSLVRGDWGNQSLMAYTGHIQMIAISKHSNCSDNSHSMDFWLVTQQRLTMTGTVQFRKKYMVLKKCMCTDQCLLHRPNTATAWVPTGPRNNCITTV